MANLVPPPTWEKDITSAVWQNWFQQLQVTVGSTDSGSYESRIAAIEASYYKKTGGIISGAVTTTTTVNIQGAADLDTTLNVDGNGTFRGVNQFGNIAGGNYSEFEADGTLEFLGNATTFRDELIDITSRKFKGARITLDDAENTLNFSTTTDITDDYVYYNVQLNHDRKNGASVFPHVHWFQEENNIPNFLFQYRWQRNGQAKETGWTNYKVTTNAYTYVSGTLNQITYGAGITPPSGDNVSDIMQIRFTRDNSNESTVFGGADAYTGVAKVTCADIHLETNTIGSRTEYNK